MESISEQWTLMHLYHATHDGANTGYTLDELRVMMDEHGPDYIIEATVTIPVSENTPETFDIPQ